MMSQREETRWRSFRQLNRNRPLKQLRILLSVAVVVALYVYCLFSQPQQSHASVVEWNIKEGKRWDEERRLAIKLAEERRKKSREAQEQAMEAARVKREAHRNATRAARLKRIEKGTNSTASGTDKEPSDSRDVLRFFGFMAIFFSTVVMVSHFRTLPTRPSPSQLRRQTRQEREARFRAWANRLNRQRRDQGEPPLSLQSLRLVMRGRDFTSGNDYEGLLQFNEEAGPAMTQLFQNMGATQEEITRCPQRILEEQDDLLQPPQAGRDAPHCSVCLETYELHDEVRTIPCFHTFHTRCIDPWLSQKAVCPVCKHPAVG